MNDIATLTGQAARSIRVDGQAYDLHPLTLDDYGRLQAWVDRQFPDPFDVVSAQIERGRLVVDADGNESRVPYPMAQQQYMLKLALEQASQGRRLIGTPEADTKVQATEGVQEMMFLSITKGRPAFTRAECKALFARLTVAQVAAIFSATNADMVLGDPKAPGTPGNAKATPSSTPSASP